MKRWILLAVLMTALPLGTMAQDDLYFTPSKREKGKVETSRETYSDGRPTYYSGSNRDVDEYNRRGSFGSYYQKIGSDSLGNDIIQFHAGNGQYPDSLVLDTIYPGSQQYYADGDDDFAYSRRMSRFDNYYGWYDPWFDGFYAYGPYWGASWRWGWYDPWFYDDLYWGYGGWYGWYRPWRYSWYGWYDPYYYGWGGPGVYAVGGHSGTRNHWDYSGRGYNPSGSRYVPAHGGYSRNGDFGGYRGGNTGTQFGNTTARRAWTTGTRTFGGARSVDGNRNYNNTNIQNRTYDNRTFGGSRSTGSFGGSRSGSSFGGGSFGGSRGGSFGGGGGSRSFGGRR